MENESLNRGRQNVICILGMHRSGTSWLSGALQSAGLYAGKVIENSMDQVRGNRENKDIMKCNIALLKFNNGSWLNVPEVIKWDANLAQSRDRIVLDFNRRKSTWMFKDPRTLVTLPFWQEGIPNLKFIGIFRHPLSVAISLFRRGNCSVYDGLKLWLEYNKLLLKYYRNEPFPIIDFDHISQHSNTSLDGVIDYINAAIPESDRLSVDLAKSFFIDDAVHNAEVDFFADQKTEKHILELIEEVNDLHSLLIKYACTRTVQPSELKLKIPIKFTRSTLMRALARQPHDGLLICLVMQFYSNLSLYDTAIKWGLIHTQRNPGDLDVLWNLGFTYFKTLDFVRGQKVMRKLINRQKIIRDSQLMALNVELQSDEGNIVFLKIVTVLIDENAVNEKLAYEYLIHRYFKMKHFARVVELYNSLKKDWTTKYDVELQVAISMCRIKMFDESEKRLKELLEVNKEKDNYIIHNFLGEIARERGDYANALVSFEQAFRLRPKHVQLAVKSGVMAKKLQAWKKAQQYFEQALTINPSLANAKSELKWLKQKVKRRMEDH